MADVPVPAYQELWTDKWSSLTNEYKDITNKYPCAAPSINQLLKVLCDIENLASYTPVSVGESEEWTAIISLAEDNRETYCKGLQMKPLFSTPYGTYAMTKQS
jgi:hypothetical protein